MRQRSIDLANQQEEEEREIRREKIVNSFNIIQMDGCNYITLNGTVISRSGDDDLIDRVNEFRRMALRKAGVE